MDWYPSRPSVGQALFGVVALGSLAALAVYWSFDEAKRGNQIFLWVLAGLISALAIVRMVVVLQLVRDRRHRR